jgi:chromosomal replication initiation ATPase DnaA
MNTGKCCLHHLTPPVRTKCEIIAGVVAEAFGISKRNLFRGGRLEPVVRRRQLAMAIMMKHHVSTRDIAAYFKMLDHATVLHAQRVVEHLRFTAEDSTFLTAYNKVSQLLSSRRF